VVGILRVSWSIRDEEEAVRVLILVLLAVVLLLAAPVGQSAEAAERLTVFGAASLTEFLQEAKPTFEKAHPGTDVRLSLAASSRCRIQIEQGAPADVFLSANTKNMDPLVEAGLAKDPVIFAHNRVVIITPGSNPARLTRPSDLAKPGLKLVTCSPEVPIGNYTRVVVDKMDASGEYGANFKEKVLANIASEEPTVKGIVAKVLLGEADAGVCYSSDVTPAVREEVLTIHIPNAVNVIADYPIAVIAGTRQRALAEDFMAFVLSPEGQRLLVKHGFVNARPTEAPEL
jgi:molybdate transport system substrate-binding protein